MSSGLTQSEDRRAGDEWRGQVALITGGANGIGAAAAHRLASLGADVVVADVDETTGRAVAKEIGGVFVATDVTDHQSQVRTVEAALTRWGRLDIVHLNAGVTTGCTVGEAFDVAQYRKAMAVNVDGAVFGVDAALPALRGRAGAQIVVTASLAGLVGVPGEPIYAATKHAVVGLVRSLGPTLLSEYGVRINALCPGFADTTLVDPIRPLLRELGIPIIPVDEVVDAFVRILCDSRSGECWCVQQGRPSEPFRFGGVPGPRTG
jgi:NAD(P)-dependent dehydrogenase (short-subunit alcohol dehydrogenase family)